MRRVAIVLACFVPKSLGHGERRQRELLPGSSHYNHQASSRGGCSLSNFPPSLVGGSRSISLREVAELFLAFNHLATGWQVNTGGYRGMKKSTGKDAGLSNGPPFVSAGKHVRRVSTGDTGVIMHDGHRGVETVWRESVECIAKVASAFQIDFFKILRGLTAFIMTWLLMFSVEATPPVLAAPPTAEAQAALRKGYQAYSEGALSSADTLFTKSIGEWTRSSQPPDEVSALYKVRGTVRKDQGRLSDALTDLDQAVSLILSPQSKPDRAEIQRTYLLRARVNAELQRWKEAESDFTAAIDRLDDVEEIESRNPYLYNERSAARSRIGQYPGAAEDSLLASKEFKIFGDKIRSLLASADAAFALYGAGDVDESVKLMRSTFNSFGAKSPTTNNPDDIGLLQELARREAELHLAYGSHLLGSAGQPDEAKKQWETGCIRLESFLMDAKQRLTEEEALRLKEAEQAQSSSKEPASLPSSAVAGNPFNSPLIAKLNGFDPESPYVTQRPQKGYFFYKVGNQVEQRDNGIALANVDDSLSCVRFRRAEWLRSNRPEWPPALVEYAEKYAASVPQGPIVIPPKGSPLKAQ